MINSHLHPAVPLCLSMLLWIDDCRMPENSVPASASPEAVNIPAALCQLWPLSVRGANCT